MKTLLTIALMGVAALLSCSEPPPATTPPAERLLFNSAFTTDSVVVDGIATGNEWAGADSIVVFDDSLRIPNEIVIRSLWDSTNLYFLFAAKDSNLESLQTLRDHPQLAKDDIIEFLLDTRDDHQACWNSDDIIYHINIFGQTKDDRGNDSCRSDARWNGIAQIATKTYGTLNRPDDIDSGYTVEVAVPWSEIGQSPKTGLVIGANFGGQSDGVFYDWVDAWPFRQPFKFGKLILTTSKHGSQP